MASSSKAFNQAFVLTIFLVACFAFTGTTHSTLNDNIENEDLVSSTCKKTLYVQLCISSLRSDPRSGSSDLKGLAAIALNLSDCLDVYSDAIQNLQDSVQALNDKSYDTLRSLVSAAMTDSETCEDGFKEVKGFRSPLTEQNKYFSRLCSNFLAITTLD